MNVFAWVLLAVLGAAAVTTWLARARRRDDLEALSRPAFWVLLLALAWLLRADTVDYGRWLLLGLLLGFFGDAVARGSAGRPTRQAALGRAMGLAARVAYLVAVVLLPPGESPVWPAVLAVALAVAAFVWMRARGAPGERRQPGLPLLAVALLAAALAMSAWWGGHVLLGWGATLLLAGDTRPALDRFDRPVPAARLGVRVLQDVAHVLVVLGMLRP